MHWRAQISASVTSRSQNAFRSPGLSGTFSGETETRTWCRTTSASSEISWRCSPTIETSPASGTNSLPSSSSSAAVASRPAKTPKLTRISRPAGSCSTAKAMAFSTCINNPYYRAGPRLTLARHPAKSAQCNNHSEKPPTGQHGHGRGLVPELLAVQVDAVDQVQEVLQREDVADRAEHFRVMPCRAEGPRQKRHRQDDDVEDRGRALERADEPGDRQAEGCERRSSERKRQNERDQMARPGGRLQHPAEHEKRRHLNREHERDREEHRCEIDSRWQGRGTDPLQDADLAARDERDREPRERGVRCAVADHPGEERPRCRAAVDVTVVDGCQQREEQDREEEHEHRRLAAAPEGPLLPLQLMSEEPHSWCSAVSAR